MIYFIQCKDLVKIGYTKSVSKRLSSIQTGNPYDLHLLGMRVGNKDTENHYHKLFNKYQKRGEWFYLDGDLSCMLFLFERGEYFNIEFSEQLEIYKTVTENGKSLNYDNFWSKLPHINWKKTISILTVNAMNLWKATESYLWNNNKGSLYESTKLIQEKIEKVCLHDDEEFYLNAIDGWQIFYELEHEFTKISDPQFKNEQVD